MREWVRLSALACAVMVPALALAQYGEQGYDESESDGAESDGAESDEAADADEGAQVAPAQTTDAEFDRLMMRNAYAPPAAHAETGTGLLPAAEVAPIAPEVVVPLDEWTRTRARLDAVRAEQARTPGPAVVLGAAEYRGEARDGALALTLKLGVTLGAPGRYKTVPLVGDDVVLVSASREGKPVPVTLIDGYHVWTTREVGEVELTVQLLVPARGPRGSIEFELGIARTPVTRFACRFPGGGLEPRIDGAVAQAVRTVGGATELDATLPPTTRVRLVGFKDLGAAEARDTKVYAETSTLLSIAQGRADVFAVIRYTILYGGTKSFAVALPAGTTVVAADGEGAFRWVVEKAEDGGGVLRGETAFPIRGAYEISLRLSRELKGSPITFDAPLPRALGVEREHGWLAVEVPGRLRLEDKAKSDVAAIDVRQLPPEMVSSAVTPILRAYRFHAPTARVELEVSRLPEKEPASAAIDRMRAKTVVSVEGKALTELKITLKNRLRPALLLTLPPHTEVRSTLLDGEPVKPSKNEQGQIMLPLRRSAGGERPEPFTLQIVLESDVGALGWLGAPSLALPAVDLPVSSLAWSVRVPGRNLYSRLVGEVAAETLAGEGRWHRPVTRTGRVSDVTGALDAETATDEDANSGGGGSGAMPVRMTLPEDGVRLEYGRYWLPEDRPVTVSFTYLRRALLGPIGALGVILLAALVVLGIERRRALGPTAAPVLAILAAALLVAGGLLQVFGAGLVVLAVLGGVVAHGIRSGRAAELRATAGTWWATLPERWRARERPAIAPRWWQVLGRLAIAGALGVALLVTSGLVFAVIDLLSRPL